MPLTIEKISFGVGDRFAHQGKAQLAAIMKAAAQGVEIVPVWNKSNREHQTIGSEIASCRAAADAAVKDLGWTRSHYVDADHINLKIVDPFLDNSDFYTIDVADAIGSPAGESEVNAFVDSVSELIGPLSIPGIPEPLNMTRESIVATANQYLKAAQLAGEIYRYIACKNGEGSFVTEGFDGRNGQPADAARIGGDPCRDRERGYSRSNDCSKVYGAIQQGSRLRWRCRTV